MKNEAPVIVRPARNVRGSVSLPGDKSISHRYAMLAGIAEGPSRIENYSTGADCASTLGCMRALGVNWQKKENGVIEVKGSSLGLAAPAAALDCGNSGSTMRMLSGIVAGQKFSSEMVGDESLSRRPMERVITPLTAMGASIESQAGKPPLRITGAALKAIDYTMPVASAQVKSAILLAGLYADGPTTVTSPAICRDHSERMLLSCGVQLTINGLTTTLHPPQRLTAQRLNVPGDFSSAAFFIVAGLLGAAAGGLVIENVGLNPTRTGLLDILRSMGGDIEILRARDSGAEPVADLHIRASKLRGIVVPEALVPLAIDEFPVLFVAAACASGETVITGAAELRVKESDRIAAMAAGLGVLGVEHEVLPDGMRIRGRAGTAFGAGTIDSHGDHRVAMSFGVASLRAAGPITIRDVANVATSFPGFVGLARSVGLDIAEREG